jgi:hypothetical protein
MSETPSIPYWHLWTDEQGISRQTKCFISEFDMQSISSGAAAQWQGRKTTGNTTIMFTVLPVGWVGDWHENPKPQWIIPLSGTWSVEAMDGTRVEFGPGDIAFGEDKNCKTVNGKTGHYSTTVGNEPAVLMLVQLDSAAIPATPCRFT